MTTVERHMVDVLRSRVERRIEEDGTPWAANRLGISEPGVRAILWDKQWSAGRAVEVAARLEVLTEADVEKLTH